MTKRTCRQCRCEFDDPTTGRGRYMRYCLDSCKNQAEQEQAVRRAERLAATVCRVDGCSKPQSRPAAQLCEMHYERTRTGKPLDDPPQMRNVTGRCMVDGCDNPPDGRYCRKHWTRLRRHGDVHTVKRPPSQAGEISPTWKGDAIGYSAAHERVRTQRGRPQRCGHCAHADPDGTFHWALNWDADPHVHTENGLPYSPDPDDYIRLCVPCHKHLDLSRPA